MNFDAQSARKEEQSLMPSVVRKRRIQERIRRYQAHPEEESPTFAYSVVYFTTVALLVTLCLQAAFH